jgi:hypothetical protein
MTPAIAAQAKFFSLQCCDLPLLKNVGGSSSLEPTAVSLRLQFKEASKERPYRLLLAVVSADLSPGELGGRLLGFRIETAAQLLGSVLEENENYEGIDH